LLEDGREGRKENRTEKQQEIKQKKMRGCKPVARAEKKGLGSVFYR
jgi:hypothetical protein